MATLKIVQNTKIISWNIPILFYLLFFFLAWKNSYELFKSNIFYVL